MWIHHTNMVGIKTAHLRPPCKAVPHSWLSTQHLSRNCPGAPWFRIASCRSLSILGPVPAGILGKKPGKEIVCNTKKLNKIAWLGVGVRQIPAYIFLWVSVGRLIPQVCMCVHVCVYVCARVYVCVRAGARVCARVHASVALLCIRNGCFSDVLMWRLAGFVLLHDHLQRMVECKSSGALFCCTLQPV